MGTSNMLSSYEDNRLYNLSLDTRREYTDKDYRAIILDEVRVDPSSGYEAVPLFYFYRFVTREILLDTNLPYYQGFFDIAFYIVYYYFKSTMREKCNAASMQLLANNQSPSFDNNPFVAISIEEEVPVERSSINIPIGEEQSCRVEKVLSANYYTHEDISHTMDKNFESTARLCIDEGTYSKCRTVVWNVINERILKLLDESSPLYNTYKEKLIQMLRRRGVDVESHENTYFIESAFFTFLSRNVEGIDNILKIYDAILSFPDYGVFLLIYHYYDIIKDKKKITFVEPDLKKHIEQIERKFNGADNFELIRRETPITMAIPIGVALGATAFALVILLRLIFRVETAAI